ncbi:MAG: hypothetical protein R3D46_01725 [Defluviimonas denitrificans]
MRTTGDVIAHPAPAIRADTARGDEPARHLDRKSGCRVACDPCSCRHPIGAEDEILPPRFGAFDPYVANVSSQIPKTQMQIDNKAELSGKARRVRGCERIGQRIGNRDVRIEVRVAKKVRPDGVHEDIAPGFIFGIRIDQIKRHQPVDQGRVTVPRHTAQLDVGAGGEVNQPVAMLAGQVGDGADLRRFQPPATGAHPHDQPVARHHRAQRAGTPALDDRRAHLAAPRAVELRRVSQRPAS